MSNQHLRVLHDIRVKVEEAHMLGHVLPHRRGELAEGACELVRLAVKVLDDLEEGQRCWGRRAKASLGGYVK